VESTVFAPDGVTVATTNRAADNRSFSTAVIWNLAELLALRTRPVGRACEITAKGLSPEEWARYVSDLPYRDSCSG
jgi:hypothetical protein